MKKVIIPVVAMVVVLVLFFIFINLDGVANFYAKVRSDSQCQVVSGCCTSYCTTTDQPKIDLSYLCLEACSGISFTPICKYKDGECYREPANGLLKWYIEYRNKQRIVF